ncbi:MAG: hypothetical protein K0S12_2165 [Bacteroidetes bacterium]|jgi:hypothetical protein|nr:hypothetical protein [Bacteroidota bacterium]
MKLRLVYWSILLLGCGSCSNREASKADAGFFSPRTESKVMESEPVGNQKESAPVHDNIPEPMEQKLIKNGNVSFRVKDLNDTRERLKKIVSSFDGYISKETSYAYSDNPTEEVTIRVPGKNFDKFMEEVLKGAEEVDAKNVDIEDVTEQFVDIEARLKNKKQLEAKYQELLLKASKMDDILKIEREISLIREDIEASEGKLRYLGNRVTFSTITLRFYEKVNTGFDFSGKLGKAVENGGTGALWFIIGFMSLWPLWIFGLILWFVILRIIRANRKKKAKTTVQ